MFEHDEVILEAKHVTRRFPASDGRTLVANDDINLKFYKGKTLGLVGSLRYCNVLHSVHKLCLSCSRMPYGTAFHLYADCICSAFFRILMPAFVSRL